MYKFAESQCVHVFPEASIFLLELSFYAGNTTRLLQESQPSISLLSCLFTKKVTKIFVKLFKRLNMKLWDGVLILCRNNKRFSWLHELLVIRIRLYKPMTVTFHLVMETSLNSLDTSRVFIITIQSQVESVTLIKFKS